MVPKVSSPCANFQGWLITSSWYPENVLLSYPCSHQVCSSLSMVLDLDLLLWVLSEQLLFTHSQSSAAWDSFLNSKATELAWPHTHAAGGEGFYLSFTLGV